VHSAILRKRWKHLFIRCPFAKLVWQVVLFKFNIPPPSNIKNLFGRELNGIDKKRNNVFVLEYVG
jgi:hypothetical protein